jgi:hypothetical protein
MKRQSGTRSRSIPSTDCGGARTELWALIGTALVAALHCCAPPPTAGAAEWDTNNYELSGSIEEHHTRAGFRRTSRFTLSALGSRWFIRIEPVNWPSALPYLEGTNAAVSVPQYIESGSDGLEFFQVVRAGQRGSDRRAPRNAALARRGPGPVPYAVEDAVLALWYTFASGHVLASATNDSIYPLESFPLTAYQHQDPRVSGRWTLADEYPFLPRALTCGGYTLAYQSGAFRLSHQAHFSTNVVLISGGLKRLEGVALPEKTTIEYYGLSSKRTSVGGTLKKRTIICAENVTRPCSRTRFRPDLPASSTLTELAFLTNAVPRPATVLFANEWLSKPAMSTNLNRTRAQRRGGFRRAAFGAKVVLLAVFAAPVALLCGRAVVEKRHKKGW